MYAAIDIGGTKTLIAVFNASGKLVESHKFPTPPIYKDFQDALQSGVKELKHQDFLAAGVAIPGRVDRKHGLAVAFGNLPWKMVPILEDVERVLHCPVVIENDARMAALSEARYLIKTYRKVLYLTVSTGIGGGLVIDGEIAPTFEDIEVGQMMFEHEGKLQRWEEFASGKAFQAKYNTRVGDMDPANQAAWYWLARGLALGIIELMATLTPEVIVIGGGAGSHLDRFKDQLVEQLKLYENPLLSVPPIVLAKHPEEAVIYGCYELAKSRFGRR